LQGAFIEADRRAIAQRLGEVNQKLAEVEKKVSQQELDAQALTLANQCLEGKLPENDKSRLVDTIKEASRSARQTIFYQAQDLRSSFWKKDKPKMEHTIPIFEALITSDSNKEYHRNHGQLGYALKDKPNPDYERAISELTEAINIRGDWSKGWQLYEFNRAYARILNDEDFRASPSRRSSPEIQQKIREDLDIAEQDDYIGELVKADKHIQEWLKLNNSK
jgi:hypothetical protein